MTYRVIEHHIVGQPAIVADSGWLVDHGPLVSVQRICAALNAAENTADLSWAVPEFNALHDIEKDRVIRALAHRVRMSAQ